MGSHQSGIQGIRDTRRYHSIDKLKMLCAFLIVCIHAPFPGMIGEYFTSLTRIAVPIFFMISGYFWKPDNSKKQIIKLIKLFLIGNITYCAFDFAKAYAQGEIRTFVGSIFNQSSVVNWVLFNDSPFAPHLWYLGAIIYVIVVFSIVEKHGITKLVLYLTPVLLLCDLAFGKYSIILFHREFSSVFLRNWIFVGIPYFAIGYFLKDRLDNYKKKLSKGMLVGGTCLFSVTTLLERLLLVSGGVIRNAIITCRQHS